MKHVAVVLEWYDRQWSPTGAYTFNTLAEAEAFCSGVDAGGNESRCAWVVEDDLAMERHGADAETVGRIRAYLQRAMTP